MADELPRPFENDDEEAADMATGRLTQLVNEARTRAEQDKALEIWRRFVEHERDKRHNPR